MNVADLCSRNVVTIDPLDDIIDAARLMRERHVGYLVVTEPDFTGQTAQVVGVLTDRDIVVSIVARGANPQALKVGDVMTAKPVVVNERDTLEKSVQEMRRIGVRRIPVVGKLGELKGVLSLDDVLDAIASELQNLASAVRHEQRIETALRP